MAYEVIMGLSASYAIVFVGTFTEYPYLTVLQSFLKEFVFHKSSKNIEAV